MSFFDTTPMGRVLNRFSKDIYVADETIPVSLRSFISGLLDVLSTIIVIIVATPYFTAVIIPLLIVYFIIQRIYVNSSRQLKRLESVSRSPIYSHFQETLSGVTTIRAYHKQEEFLEQSEHKVDYNQEAYYPGICATRWVSIRLEFIGNLVVFFAALFAVLAVVFPDASKTITPGLAGLSISYALQVTITLLYYCVRGGGFTYLLLLLIYTLYYILIHTVCTVCGFTYVLQSICVAPFVLATASKQYCIGC